MGSGTSRRKEINQAKTKVGTTRAFLNVGKEHQQTSPRKTASVTINTDTNCNDKTGSQLDDSQLHLSEERKETRRDIFEFLESCKRDRVLVDIELGSQRILPKHDNPGSVMEEDPVYKIPDQVDPENRCTLCNKATMYMLNGFPCRVCSTVLHLDCLKDSKRYTEQELKMVHRAKSSLGWSCETCDNTCNLLSPDELQTISDDFEKLDVNRDADISFDEFIEFQRKEHELVFGKPMDEFDQDLLEFQFKMLDADKSGSIDYKEFMKHQATKTFGRKDKHQLVKWLTANEIRAAKLMFDMLDADHDGTVSEAEARNAYRSFYSMLETLSEKQSLIKNADETGMLKPDIETPQVASHVCTNADLIMDADENQDCTVDWKEFLRGQALSIISSRPNKYGIPNQC